MWVFSRTKKNSVISGLLGAVVSERKPSCSNRVDPMGLEIKMCHSKNCKKKPKTKNNNKKTQNISSHVQNQALQVPRRHAGVRVKKSFKCKLKWINLFYIKYLWTPSLQIFTEKREGFSKEWKSNLSQNAELHSDDTLCILVLAVTNIP